MSIKDVSVKLVMVDPDKAREWLADNYEKQRPLLKHYVDLYANEMKQGRFRPGTEITFAVNGNGRSVLINGQHTLSAIISSSLPQRLNTTEYLVENEDDIARLYYRIDMHRARTFGDAVNVFGLPEKVGLKKRYVTKLATAAKVIHNGFIEGGKKKVKILSDDMIDLVLDWQAEGRRYFDLIAGCSQLARDGLERAPTLSVALVTLRHAPLYYGEDKVDDFWRGISQDDGLQKSDPRKTALRHMVSDGLAGGSTVRNKARTVSAPFAMRYVANCWNAWVEDRTLADTRVSDASAPIKILGTPWKG